MFLKLVFIAYILIFLPGVHLIFFESNKNSYALYPIWNACSNASLSFEFKTKQQNGLLFYVDDQTGDGFDFIQVHVENGKLRMASNIVDGSEGSIQITFENTVNDGLWHSVKYQRNRMTSIFTLDGQTKTAVAFGSDFHFGKSPNTYVYFGGLRPNIGFHDLSMPSVKLVPRFEGAFRNIFYQNCTCHSVRVKPITGSGYSLEPKENCEVKNPCKEGCLCVSTNLQQPLCNCTQLECLQGKSDHYHLSMDKLHGTTVVNNDGLDASLYGPATFIEGVNNSGILLDGVGRYIRVSGPSHRNECFGDITLCRDGYTVAVWIKIMPPISSKSHVYLSNGGHSDKNHGVAMLYERGWLHVKFKDKEGGSWTASAQGVLPGNWYHVTGVLDKQSSRSKLFVDGKDTLLDGSMVREPRPQTSGFNDYVLGRANEPLSDQKPRVLLVDEFHFWPRYMGEREARELGPLYSLKMSFDGAAEPRGVSRVGSPKTVDGIMEQALDFDGRDDYIIIDQQGKASCFTDLSLCLYGATVGAWVKLKSTTTTSYILDSGALKLYVKDAKAHFETKIGEEVVMVRREKVLENNKWYYIEGTWDKSNSKIFINHQEGEVVENIRFTSTDLSSAHLMFVGKEHSSEVPSNMVLDEFEMFYGDRMRLNRLNLRLTGRPNKEEVLFDGDVQKNSKLKVSVFGSPKVVLGPKGKAREFDGSEYVSLGQHEDACLGNLDFCPHGVLMSLWIKPNSLKEGMHLFSTGSNGLKGQVVRGKKLKIVAKTTANEWVLFSEPLENEKWNFVELSWKAEKGLRLYVDQQLLKQSTEAIDRADQPESNPNSKNFYVGRGDGLESGSKFGKFAVDDLKYWYADREYLLAFGYIQRGKPESLHIDMDKMAYDRMENKNYEIASNTASQTVSGKMNNAYPLNGRDNYLTVKGIKEGCFKDLNRCPHGLTLAFFAQFQPAQQDEFYFSNGGGVAVYQRNNQKYVSLVVDGNKWEVPLEVENEKWHFIETSWHPDKGVKLYVDNKLVKEASKPQKIVSRDLPPGHFYVGYGNQIDQAATSINPGRAVVDELEMWQGDKEYLDSFGYIYRDKVPHYSFPMENERGNKILHPDIEILKYNGARLSEGKVGKGLELGGNGEYAWFGDQRNSCLGNLTRCLHGATTSFFIYPSPHTNSHHYYLSSAASSFFSNSTHYTAVYRESDKEWRVTTDQIKPDQWQKVDLSWHPDKGLKMYKDGVEVARDTIANNNTSPIYDHNLYLGRPTDDRQQGSMHGKGKIDELEFWFADRNHLKAFDLIKDDVKQMQISMDELDGGVVSHATQSITSKGGVKLVDGVNGKAVSLSGNGQYLDLGQKTICNSDLETCPNGFTTRFKIRPHKLSDGSYIFSSPFASVYQRDGKIESEVRTKDKKWRTVSKPLSDDAWSQVDVSWHPSEGVSLYVNNEKVSEGVYPVEANPASYDPSTPFYVGRDTHQSFQGHYARIDMDDLEFYEVKRESLIPNYINPDEDQISIERTQQKFLTAHSSSGTTIPPRGKEQAITFMGSAPQVSLPRWFPIYALEFFFTTNQPNALIFYQEAQLYPLSVEMYDGLLYLNIGPFRYQFPSNDPLNDNQAHRAVIQFSTQSNLLTLDDNKKAYDLNFPIAKLKPEGDLLVGGVQDDEKELSYHIWNRIGASRRYLGCLWGIKINNKHADLLSRVPHHDNIKQRCRFGGSRCHTGLCGEGRCINLWNDFKCDCSRTNYYGKNCEQVSKVGSFSGDERVRMNFNPTVQSNHDDFSLRFRTLKENSFLLSTSNNENNDNMKLSIYNGKGKVETSFRGRVQETYDNCPYKLNDAVWHTMWVQKRGATVRVNVDDCPPSTYEIVGHQPSLNIDHIHIGEQALSEPFVGEMRNVFVKDTSVLDNLASSSIPGVNIESDLKLDSTEQNILYPVTFRNHPSSLLQLNPLNNIHSSELEFALKTEDSQGLLLYNADPIGNFFAVELHEGRLRLLANNKALELPRSLNLADGKWHKVRIKPNTYPQHQLNVSVDDFSSYTFNLGDKPLHLSENLMVGGSPPNSNLHAGVKSGRKGFTGCLAGFSINGNVFDLVSDAVEKSSFVTSGCTDTSVFCTDDLCKNKGVCKELKENFLCDCSLTSYAGHYCHAEADGLRFGNTDDKGIAIYRIEPPVDTREDQLAFGLMTWRENGTLVKVNGLANNHFIHAFLNEGNLTVKYDVGDGEKAIIEDKKALNDGDYHNVLFTRRGGSASLSVDDLPSRNLRGSESGDFRKMHIIKLGGDLDPNYEITDAFDGIIAGVHLNGHNVIEEGNSGKRYVTRKGDLQQALHPFYLEKPKNYGKKKESKQDSYPGGGVLWKEARVVFEGKEEPIKAAVVGIPSVVASQNYPRASAFTGATLGVLLVVSSLVWLVFKLKPGQLLSSLNFSSYKSVDTGFTSKSGEFMMQSSKPIKSETKDSHIYDTTSAFATLRSSQGVSFNDPSNIQQANISSQGAAIYEGFSNNNTFQDNNQFNDVTLQQNSFNNQQNMYSQGQNYSQQQFFTLPPSQDGALASPLLPAFQQQNTFQQQHFNTLPQQVEQHLNFTQQNQQHFLQNQSFSEQQNSRQYFPQNISHQYHNAQQLSSQADQPPFPNLMSSEDIRVDCVKLSTNGRFVVTGSSFGPPQIWDMKTGELVRIMQGDDLSSTDLHLANGDSMLVGLVTDSQDSNDYLSSKSLRKLQTWDFASGKFLPMHKTELGTASCMMDDGDKIVLGRTEGANTTIVIWDILANEPQRYITWHGFVGAYDDPLTFIKLSHNNRYIVVGTQNTSDASANYATFDLSASDMRPPNVVSLNADVSCTEVLEKQQAVTGTRSGELLVWSLITGKALKQLMSPLSNNMTAQAHQGEVTDLCISKDFVLLVSSSADGTLKVWDLETESLQRVLSGHLDEVLCCSISSDNELVASGSLDQTIRLWKLLDGHMLASIHTGLDVFKILLSNNKRTIVALADKMKSRKLVMLQVLRNKLPSASASRTTSPLSSVISPQYR